ncbi:MAG: hypothetical protein U9N84_05460 [Actinomycetota bacterium]|nr:hypothetical protein [Actinomycetota bacterium]
MTRLVAALQILGFALRHCGHVDRCQEQRAILRADGELHRCRIRGIHRVHGYVLGRIGMEVRRIRAPASDIARSGHRNRSP